MFKLRSISGLIAASLVSVPALLSFPVDGWAQIEEITVTTRRREENLQDVPISVDILSAGQIERYGIYDIKDVAKYTAGMEFDEGYGAQDTRIVLRGLSPSRGRANVAFLMDGIDFTGEAIQTAGGGFLVNQRLIDVERIEVVKGPQSALYGRSAFAGAVQYVTKNPNMEELESDVFVDIGDEEQYTVTAAIGGPVTEKFGLRLNGMWYDKEGFYTNTITGGNVGGSDGWGLALKGLWEPTEALSFAARLAYSDDHFDVGAQARVPSNTLVDLISPIPGGNLIEGTFFGGGANSTYPDCPTAAGTADNTITSCTGTAKVLVTGMIPDADQLQVVQATDPVTGDDYNGTEHELLTFTLVAGWDVGFGSFSSYTGVADSDSEQRFEGNWDAMPAGDYASLDGLYTFTLPPCGRSNCSPSQQQIAWDNEISLFSQEIRYASNFDGPVQFTVGGLYWHEDAEQVSVGNSTISPSIVRGLTTGAPGFFGPITAQPPAWQVLPTVNFPEFPLVGRDTEHWSAYGLVEWDISSAWTLSFEGRYVDEDLTVEGPVCDPQATHALTGYTPLTDPAGDVVCSATFRGPSSTAQANVGGPFNDNSGSLPDGTYSTAVTFTGVGKTDDSFFTPKVTLEWTPTDNQMWYLSWAEGKKPGGLSTISAGTFFDVQGRTFEQETLTNWEIGGKTGWLDNNLVINGAAFFQDYKDKQVGVTQFNPRTQSDFGSIENAGEAEIWGVEFTAQWQPGERWLLSAGYTWLDAEYTKFESITGSANEVARAQAAGNGGCLEIIPSATPNTDDIRDRCVVNRNGNKIEDIPENSFVGGVQYMASIGGSGLDWFAEVNAIFTDERWVEENNVQLLDSYWLFDFRLGLRADSWDVLFYVDNLTDDDTSKSALDVGSQTNTMRQGQWPPGPTDGVIVNLPDPRIYGIRATFRF